MFLDLQRFSHVRPLFSRMPRLTPGQVGRTMQIVQWAQWLGERPTAFQALSA
jgi:hypothetical protein